MSDAQGRILLNVQSMDALEPSTDVDLLVVSAERRKVDRVLRAQVPLDRELADVPCTIIVRANPSSTRLLATCDILGSDGARRLLGRSSDAVSVFLYTGSGILVTGLPPTEAESAL